MAKPAPAKQYGQNVFINCPFDKEYSSLFDAIVFTVHDMGFRPRCALEARNAGQFRLEKILEIKSKCKYSIHDLSRTELDPENRLPRFNMPFELGLDLGCKKFGSYLIYRVHRRLSVSEGDLKQATTLLRSQRKAGPSVACLIDQGDGF